MTRDQQIVEASLRLPYLKNQDQQLCFQQGAVWADHNPAWQGETIYHVTVSGHASNNKGKIREYRDIFEPFGFQVYSQSEKNIDLDVEETGTTYRENSFLKANAFRKIVPFPVLSDDSGLEIDALRCASDQCIDR